MLTGTESESKRPVPTSGNPGDHDGAAAELSAPCREAFGVRLPPGEECSLKQRCVECGKQSATRVDIARIDALLAEAQAHLASALDL